MSEPKKSLKISGETTYKVDGSMSPPISVMLREISVSGLKFVSTDSLPIGTVLELSIKVTPTSDPMPAKGKVIWQGHGSSKFLLDTDIEFVEISQQDQSRLSNFITNSAANIKAGRLNVRCAMSVEVTYSLFVYPDVQKKCESGDIGVEGMKLFVKEHIDIGKDLKINFDLPRGWGAVGVSGTVVWKGQEMNGIIPIGVKFIDIQNQTKKRIIHFVDYTLSHQ